MGRPEHAVIVHYPLSDGDFGTLVERDAVRVLKEQLDTAIEAAEAGEFDGDEFGGGEAVLYAYGPDATRLFAAMEPYLRDFPARPAHALLRFGEAGDPDADEQRIDL